MTLIRTRPALPKSKDWAGQRSVGCCLDDLAGRDLVRKGSDPYCVVGSGRGGAFLRIVPHETDSLALLAPRAFVLLLIFAESLFQASQNFGGSFEHSFELGFVPEIAEAQTPLESLMWDRFGRTFPVRRRWWMVEGM